MQATALYGVGLTTERLEEIAAAIGAPARAVGCGLPAEGGIGLGGAAVVAADLDEECLLDALGRGASAFIEADGMDKDGIAAALRQAAGSALYVSMTTATAYCLPLAQGVINAIDHRCSL